MTVRYVTRAHAQKACRTVLGQTHFHGQTAIRCCIASMKGICFRRENASVPDP